MFDAFDLRHYWLASSGHEDLVCLVNDSVHLNLVFAKEMSESFDVLDVAFLPEIRVEIVEFRNPFVSVQFQAGIVEFVVHFEAEALHQGDLFNERGSQKVDLLGHAADIHAGAAWLFVFDEDHGLVELGPDISRRSTASTSSSDDQVVHSSNSLH